MKKNISSNVSRTMQTRLVLPPDTNHLGTAFGGTVLAYIDEIAAITAMKHSNSTVVTASIDTVNFLSPAKAGDILMLEGVVVSTGRTSMEIFVKVESQQVHTGVKTMTTTALLTMVAVDNEGVPTKVAGVIPETEEEKNLHHTAQVRKERRLRIREHSVK